MKNLCILLKSIFTIQFWFEKYDVEIISGYGENTYTGSICTFLRIFIPFVGMYFISLFAFYLAKCTNEIEYNIFILSLIPSIIYSSIFFIVILVKKYNEIK